MTSDISVVMWGKLSVYCLNAVNINISLKAYLSKKVVPWLRNKPFICVSVFERS